MPIQNYEIYTGNAYKGQISDASTPRVIGSIVAAVELGFGIAMTAAGGIDPNAGVIHALSTRELNHEAANRPSDGSTKYPIGQTVSAMREGYINLEAIGGAAVEGVAVKFDALGEVDMGAGGLDAFNVFWAGTGVIGEVVRARIDIVGQ